MTGHDSFSNLLQLLINHMSEQNKIIKVFKGIYKYQCERLLSSLALVDPTDLDRLPDRVAPTRRLYHKQELQQVQGLPGFRQLLVLSPTFIIINVFKSFMMSS